MRGVANHQKWHTVELLTQRRLLVRPVGCSMAAGLLSGVGIAAIPYWIAASGVFAGSVLVMRSAEALVAPFPASVAWDLSASVLAVGIFGFWFPLAGRLRQPAGRWIAIVAVGIVVIGHAVTPFSTLGRIFSRRCCSSRRSCAVYLEGGRVGRHGGDGRGEGGAGAVRDAGATRRIGARAGVPLLLTWGIVLAASVAHGATRPRKRRTCRCIRWRRRPVEQPTGKTGRMRLEAEFEVARKAQQDALPAAAPAMEGYTLAGSCEPAQQVGGDLYDYFSLADGRLGIAVADVSGKGVPAALYMMVTKGLLAATTRDSSDLSYILQQINRHLYRACKKKVFVTLAAVALDPATRRLQHGRAGHNPIVWRRVQPRRDRDAEAARAGPRHGHRRALQSHSEDRRSGIGAGRCHRSLFGRHYRSDERQLEQFGEARLMRAVESTDGQPAEESRAAILRRVGRIS